MHLLGEDVSYSSIEISFTAEGRDGVLPLVGVDDALELLFGNDTVLIGGAHKVWLFDHLKGCFFILFNRNLNFELSSEHVGMDEAPQELEVAPMNLVLFSKLASDYSRYTIDDLKEMGVLVLLQITIGPQDLML